MADKHMLQSWVVDAVRAHGGSARPLDVAKHIWRVHETELRASEELFYSWQYDMRWAAQRLRDQGVFAPKHGERRGTWDLAD
jgi:hypothetical protein